jgi:hypothetical protein
MGKRSLSVIAEEVINQLQDQVIIHRYDAFSTNSIYLKFDYGLAYSLRISDHAGKKHLAYRFNILESMAGESSKRETINHGCKMVFYGPHMVSACCRDVLKEKERKRQEVTDYQALLLYKARTCANTGFWGGARQVN